MLGFAVAVALASYGNEGSREEKFRGALIAQASAPSTLDRAAVQRELDNLVIERPDFVPAGIAMSIGGVFALGGVVCLSIMAALASGTLVGIALLVVGAIFLPAGAVVMLVGGLVMLSVAHDRRVFDERIRVLQERLGQPPSAAASSPSLLLARF